MIEISDRMAKVIAAALEDYKKMTSDATDTATINRSRMARQAIRYLAKKEGKKKA